MDLFHAIFFELYHQVIFELRASHDRIIADYDSAVLYFAGNWYQFYFRFPIPLFLRWLGVRPAGIILFDKNIVKGDLRFLGKANGMADPGIGHRRDNVGRHGITTSKRSADVPARAIHGHAVDYR